MKANACRVLLTLFFLATAACAGDVAPTNQINENNPIFDAGADTTIPDAGMDAAPEPDVTPEPDVVDPPDIAPPLPDTDPNNEPQSCTDPSECTAPEVCIIDTISGDGECGEPVDNREAGRTCTMSNQCASGICLDGECVDHCTTSADCSGGRVCQTTNLGGLQVDVCLEPDPCTSNDGCADPFICVIDRSDAIRVACLDPHAGGGTLGDACAADTECLAGLCLGGTCTQPCDSPDDCGNDGDYSCTSQEIDSATGQFQDVNVCTLRPPNACLSDAACSAPERCVAGVTSEGLMFACGDPNVGGGESNDACNSDADCAQNLCLDGLCAGPCSGNASCDVANDHTCKTLPVEREGESASLSVCKAPTLCDASSQCAAGETCYVRRSGAQLETYCRAPNAGGANQGNVCEGDANCRSNYCHEGRFRQHCAVPCTTNSDCNTATSLTYVCRNTDIPLTSGGTDSAGICVLADPVPCSSQDDCVAGTTQCAVVANTTNTALETVCIPNQGGLNNGAACTLDSQCRGQLCFEGQCSTPCERENQCGGAQICGPNTVTKEGLTANLNVCEPLKECSSSADCAAPRVCNSLYTVGGELTAFCGFPNTTGSQLGESCTDSAQCREDLCLTFSSNECSLFCTQNSDCGTSQICTNYAGIGMCMTPCTHNGSCSGGNICTYHINTSVNQVDYICHQPYGAGTIGQACDDWDDCATGVCLEMSLYTYNPNLECTTDAQCNAEYPSCECPLSNPNCTTGKLCAGIEREKQCSQVCDPQQGNTHCPADSLSRCTDDVRLSWPGGSDNVSACSRPTPE